ncbi:uncharacterized protein LOC122642390 isoform X1 [Telopea speciosissima]|uniref:uncharacterized protein LOC122642390 isoform X1 n=1 Tax=Telopea speciosissima TaxID=54955 RepID=UPI001CC3F98E|nr:uncharacterized protein LOC122642390 isoform X1 [Telopea speciosissima]
MSQENQVTNSSPMENAPVKRKRGRPRKDENLVCGKPASTSPPVIDIVRRKRRRRVDEISDAMVGQAVSGVLEGSFEAGYMLTVKVGDTNTVLRGVVFEPGLSVPISVANDVAPHVKMFKRNEISLPTQVRGTNLQSEQNNERLVKVSVNEGVLASKVFSPVKLVPRAPQLSPYQVQINPMAFSKGEVNDANNVPKTAPHALQPEESKTKCSPSLPAKGLAGEASGDANHADQVSSQLAASQTENRIPTDVMQNDKSGLPTREAEALPVDAGQVVQISMQTAAPQIEKRKSIDLFSNKKSDLSTTEPEGGPSDINQMVHVPSQAAVSQVEALKSTYVLPNDKFDLPAREPECPLNDASQVVEDSLQAAAPQRDSGKSANVVPDDKTDLPTGEAEVLPVDAGKVVQISMQTAAPQIEKRKSIDLFSNDKSDLPTSEPEGVPSDINEMVHVPSQAAASQVEALKSIYVLPNDKHDLPAREPEGPLNDASQVVEDSLQAAAPQRESGKSANMVSDDKTDLLTRELDSSNQASLIKPEQVVQPVVKGEPSATQPLQLEHDRVVAPAEKFQENESAALIKRPLKNSNAPEDSKSIPSTEPSVEKLSGSESIDQVTQVHSHVMISELQPGWHADNALTSGGFEVKLNCIPVSDPPQPVATQPDNEVTNFLEKKASPKGDTPQDLTFKLSDEIPSRVEFSQLDGRAKADVSEVTEGHTESESQISQSVDVFHRGISAQISYSSMAMQNEAIPSEQPSQELQKGTTPAVSLDLELNGHQISTSTLPIQNEDSVAEDAVPSIQSQYDPEESKVTGSMST